MKTSLFISNGMFCPPLATRGNQTLSSLILPIMQYWVNFMPDWRRSDPETRRVSVLLFPQFSMHCLANTVEPMRAANTLLGRYVYHWQFLSLDGLPVASSSGLPVTPDAALGQMSGDLLFLMPSYGARKLADAATLRALRSAARRFRILVGMDMGSWLLASADLLAGHRATIHWEEYEAFSEAFPEVDAVKKRLVMQGNRWSCGGAMTAFDLILRMIGEDHGEALRLEVAALFMQGEAEDLAPRLRPRSQLVAAAVAQMRDRLEDPASIAEIAAQLGTHQRDLEALFKRQLGATPRTVYRRIRLVAARRYVEQTQLSVAEIAVRCGYQDPSAMTRAFTSEFGDSPRSMRANFET
jgi:transcriptional regulator GlxA family with amidase domain